MLKPGRTLRAAVRIACSQAAAELHAYSVEDAIIAAIVLANQFILVTRNTKDFEGMEGLVLLNPWLEARQ